MKYPKIHSYISNAPISTIFLSMFTSVREPGGRGGYSRDGREFKNEWYFGKIPDIYLYAALK